ncbi:serine/threonine protein phosphatase [Nocardioides currus]|uniref:Serine/threonine protein phosphatase n=1 Tax=Nocardioides currus TaxID=2133958 RepID=A0A2R7YUX8_9ACTN|nr:serine/threonine protein phosphatase [Nocardioides currus]
MTCPSCGTPAEGDSNFCEECGAALGASPPPDGAPRVLVTEAAADEPSPIDDLGSGPISRATSQTYAPAPPAAGIPACASCGGEVGPDGYCEQCGVKALSPRDHFREQPAPWVAGVCDKGIRHSRNEDAMALSASPDGSGAARRAVLVVLDGVSNTDDSQVGSLAGARAALGALVVPLPVGMGTPEGRLAAATRAMSAAVDAANAQVESAAPADAANPASATFCAAVLEGDTLTYANVGDSRIYWLPDGGEGVQLSVDDSAAQDQIEAGVPRLEAETSAQAHAITKWLGRDSQGHEPRVGQMSITEPGWVLVCSDGLWNYASEPAALAQQVAAAATTDPAALALALTDFANASGGQDNITVALARVSPAPAP